MIKAIQIRSGKTVFVTEKYLAANKDKYKDVPKKRKVAKKVKTEEKVETEDKVKAEEN